MQSIDMFSISGQAAIVTGGASGLGLAFAEVLAECGARVMLLDANAETLQRETLRFTAQGHDVQGRVLDVTDRPALDQAFDEAAAQYGRLDTVFVNAGVDPGPGFVSFTDPNERLPTHAIENYEDARWLRVIDVSLNAAFYCIRAAARHMRPRRSGRIVVTTSISALRPAPGIGAAYMAAKAGAAHLVRTAALELARDNVLVNAIAPGPFVTNIAGGRMQDPALQVAFARTVPLGRMAHTDEVKGLALLLASPASSFITGAQIVIDGGASLGSVG